MTCGPGTFGDWFLPDWLGLGRISAACLAPGKAVAYTGAWPRAKRPRDLLEYPATH